MKRTIDAIRILFSFFLILGLGGCRVGPTYMPPKNTTSDHWASSSEMKDLVLSQEKPFTEWWKVFEDPLLDKILEKAMAHNQDLLKAEANICQARAFRQVEASSLFPQIAGDVNATRNYFSKNGPIVAIEATNPPSGTFPAVQMPFVQNLFNAFFDASWEIDFFGKTRRKVEAAEANIGSAIEQRNDLLLSILAEVSRNYIEVRHYQELGVLLEEDIQWVEQKAVIIRKQKESGYANQLDEENIEAVLAFTRSNLPNVRAKIYQGIYALSALIGEPPEALLEELLPIKPLPKMPKEIAIGLRSDLLRRRPDVRQAERQLAASVAEVGVSVASFFPTVTLGANLGLQSLKIANLFTLASKTWSFGGDVNVPIFQGGRLTGNLKLTRAKEAMAAHQYQSTVLKALQETESALIAYHNDLLATKDKRMSEEKRRARRVLAEARYHRGLVDLNNLIDIEREWNLAKINALDSDRAALVDLIALYKALGGGWEKF